MAGVRIGFVGAGTMGQAAHLRNYATLEGCEVAALAELRPRTARLVAERYGIPKVYADHKEMLDAEGLDGVVASQPFDRHAVLLPEVYGRVPHVFTEKPLAVSVEAGERLAALAGSSGTVHMVGYHKRSDPATVYANGVIEDWKASGRMGRQTYVRILMPAGDWTAGGFAGLLKADDEAPSGLATEPAPPGMDSSTAKEYVAFVNYYIHQVNLLRHLLGEPYRIAYAERSGVLLVGESASGVPCTIEMSPYRTTVAWEESALVAFEKGYVKLRLPAPLAAGLAGTVEVYEDPGEGVAPARTSPELRRVCAMRQQATNFIRVCRGEMPPPCDAAEAVEDLKAARDYVLMNRSKA
jgi:predicted dehydrogenase